MALGFAPPELEQAVLRAQAQMRLALQQAQKTYQPPVNEGARRLEQANLAGQPQAQAQFAQQTSRINAQQVANLLTRWASYAPYLPPTIAVPLANQGVDPDSDLGMSIVKNHYGLMNPVHPANTGVDGPVQLNLGAPGTYDVARPFAPQGAPGTPGFPLTPGQPQRASAGFGLGDIVGGVESALGATANAAKRVAEPLVSAYQALDSQAAQNFDTTRAGLGLSNAPGPTQAADALKTGARFGLAGLQSGYETGINVGAMRSPGDAGPLIQPRGYSAPNPDTSPLDALKATTLWQMIQGANSGQGILPNGPAVQRAQALQREVRGTIDGHAVTPGRLLASEVVEPGTRPYQIMSGLVDAGVAWNGDPAAATLKLVGDAREAQKAFDLYGVTHGTSTSVDAEHAANWLDSEPGQKVLEQLAGRSSTTDIQKAMSKTNPFPWDMAARLADARTPADVRAILEPELGLRVPEVPGPSFQWSSPLRNSRWAQLIPGTYMDASDPQQRTEMFDRWLSTAKVDAGTRDILVHDMALAPDRTTALKVAERGMAEAKDVLVNRYNVPDWYATQLTRMFKDESEANRLYHVGANGESVTLPGLTVDGEAVKTPGPWFAGEMLNNNIPLPPWRDLKRAASGWEGVLRSPAVAETPMIGGLARAAIPTGEALANLAMAGTSAWKIAVHARLALTTRLLGEAQARMSAAGIDSMFTHPLDYIASVIGKKGDAFGVPFDNMINDAQGLDEYAKAMGPGYRGMQGFDAADQGRLKGYDIFSPGSSDYNRAWASELQHASREPVMSRIAAAIQNGEGTQAVKDWFFNDSPLRQQLVDSGGWRALLANRNGSDAYINMLADHLDRLTAQQPDLLDAVVKGDFGKKYGGASRSFMNSLDRHVAQGIGPDAVRGVSKTRTITVGGNTSALADYMDHGANWMFKNLITKPSVKLARSETFNDYYWQDMGRMWNGLDEDARNAVRNTIADPNSSFVPKKNLSLFASSPTTKSEPGTDIYRFSKDELGQSITRPQGAYFGVGEPDQTLRVASDETLHRMKVAATKPLHVVKELSESAGEAAAHALLPAGEFEALKTTLYDDQNIAGAIAKARVMGAKISKADEAFLLAEPPGAAMDAIGCSLARNAGYDAIHATPSPEILVKHAIGAIPEYVALQPSGLNLATSRITLEQADKIAKMNALNQTNKLLYNFADRNQMADAMRVVAPFGEIWKKEIVGWAKLVNQEPQIIRRGQQIIQAARDSGFFYKDPSGQELFTIVPAPITNAITGVPFPLTGQVSGLNILGQGLPGVGPAIQIPAAKLIPDTPAYQSFRHAILPYGDPGAAEDLSNIFMPKWMERLKESGWLYDHTGLFKPSPTQARVYGDTVKQVMAYLNSTGGYDTSTPEGMQKLLADAQQKAQSLYLLRSSAQFVSPAAPSAMPQVKAKDGRLYEFYVMSNDFHKMQQADPQNATQQFIQKYGQRAFLATVPFAQRNVYGAPTTQQAEWWRAQNPKFSSTYKDVAGYFGPQDGNFDYNAYMAAIQRGDISPLSPQDWLLNANQRLAADIYATQRAKVPTNAPQADLDWLSGIQKTLKQQFPGYDPQGSVGTKHSLDYEIRELGNAAQDPSMKANPIAYGIDAYMKARAQVMAVVAQAGPRATLARKEFAADRAWLRGVGQTIAQAIPQFQAVWDDILYREVPIENEGAAATPVAVGAP